MKKRYSGLTGHVIDAMKDLCERKNVIDRYFRSDSRAWRAICDHIWHADDCVLIDRLSERHGERVSIACYRGEGAAIHLRGYNHYIGDYTNDGQHIPAKVFCIDFGVEYGEEEGHENFTVRYSLQVPVALEDDCDDEEWGKRWASWLAAKTEERNHKRTAGEIAELNRLMTKYPKETAARVIAEMKKE